MAYPLDETSANMVEIDVWLTANSDAVICWYHAE